MGATNNDFNTSYTLGGSAVKVIEFSTTTNDTSDRTINLTVTDDTNLESNTAVSTITLTNNPLALDLDGGSASNNFTNEYTPARGAVAAV